MAHSCPDAYYNEADPFCAAWLRNLIEARLIAPGEVDERSIIEVRPDDLRGFTQCHFFAGIGTWSYALRRAGWPDDAPVWTGSCPCQSFSASGKRRGFSDERHLWPAWERLIEACRPSVIFGEQVASALVIGKSLRKMWGTQEHLRFCEDWIQGNAPEFSARVAGTMPGNGIWGKGHQR